jgi:hypothetical protein
VKYAFQESPHSENTAFPRSEKEERGREHVFTRILISNKTPQTINENKEHLGLPPWNDQWQNNWGFKPCSRVHQPHTCFNRFSYGHTSKSCLGEITPTHPSAQQCYMQKQTHIKHKKLIALQSNRVGTQ